MSALRSDAAQYNFSELTILVVDGNDFARSFTRNICRGFRFRDVLTSKDPVEAIGQLKSKPIDLVIAEWAFRPVGGEAFVRHIRSLKGIKNPYVPIIILTAFSDLETVAQARDAGATEFLTRPLVLGNLLSRMTHAMANPRPFVRSDDYFGPDRRRKARQFTGRDRRVGGSDKVRITQSNLAKALADKVKMAGGLTIDEMVIAGEEVIEREEMRYTAVRRQDLKDLILLVRELKDTVAPSAELVEKIYLKSHDLKGMGETFGYPLMTQSGDSLCKLLWKLPPQRASAPIIIQGVETHAMVMNLIVDQEIRDDGGELGSELVEGLRALVAKAAGEPERVAAAG